MRLGGKRITHSSTSAGRLHDFFWREGHSFGRRKYRPGYSPANTQVGFSRQMTANPDLGIRFWTPSSVFVALPPLRQPAPPPAICGALLLMSTTVLMQLLKLLVTFTVVLVTFTTLLVIFCGTSAAVPLAYTIRRLFLVERCVSRRHAARHMLARDVDVPITRILVWTGHDGLYDQQADFVPFLVARQVSRILPRAPLAVVLPLSRVTMANIGVTLCEGDNERSRFVGKAKSLDFANRLFSLLIKVHRLRPRPRIARQRPRVVDKGIEHRWGLCAKRWCQHPGNGA